MPNASCCAMQSTSIAKLSGKNDASQCILPVLDASPPGLPAAPPNTRWGAAGGAHSHINMIGFNLLVKPERCSGTAGGGYQVAVVREGGGGVLSGPS